VATGGRRRSNRGAFANRKGPGARTAPAFDGQDLIVQGAKIQAMRSPSGEMICNRDGTAGAGTGADGNVLLKGSGSCDGGLVDLLVLPDLVRSTIAREGTQLRTRVRIASRCLHNVVFHKWVCAPAIDSKNSNAACDGERAAKGDRANRAVRVNVWIMKDERWCLLL
jgi:hypothetical protein